jgi:hypothetical protein
MVERPPASRYYAPAAFTEFGGQLIYYNERLPAMKLRLIVCATAALAACSAAEPDYAGVAAGLDQARAQIAPPLGATTYTLDSRRLLDQPGDENRSLAQSLGQLPGVMLEPNGQLRVRGQ